MCVQYTYMYVYMLAMVSYIRELIMKVLRFYGEFVVEK